MYTTVKPSTSISYNLSDYEVLVGGKGPSDYPAFAYTGGFKQDDITVVKKSDTKSVLDGTKYYTLNSYEATKTIDSSGNATWALGSATSNGRVDAGCYAVVALASSDSACVANSKTDITFYEITAEDPLKFYTGYENGTLSGEYTPSSMSLMDDSQSFYVAYKSAVDGASLSYSHANETYCGVTVENAGTDSATNAAVYKVTMAPRATGTDSISLFGGLNGSKGTPVVTIPVTTTIRTAATLAAADPAADLTGLKVHGDPVSYAVKYTGDSALTLSNFSVKSGNEDAATVACTAYDAATGTLTIQVTPRAASSDEFDITVDAAATTTYKSATYTVKAKVAADAAALPSAATGLTYNGSDQTGVAAGTGYTLSAAAGSAVTIDTTGNAAATDTGDYSVTATLGSGYQWPDNDTNATKTLTFSVAKATLQATVADVSIANPSETPKTPAVTVAGFQGSDTEASLASAGYVQPTVVMPTTPYAENTTYPIKLEGGTPTANYQFDYGQGTLTVGVLSTAAVPTAATGLTYTGSVQTGVAAGTGYTVEGGTATNAGTYTATAKLQSGYKWSDGLSADKSITWSIARATVKAPAAATGLTYTGAAQTGVASGTGYTLSGMTQAKHAGAYTATAKLDANHAWSDNTTADASIAWSIAKARLTATYAGETIAYDGTPTYTMTVTGFVGGETATTAQNYTAPTVTAPSAIEAGQTYTLAPANGAADDYSFTYMSGNLVVGAAPLPAATLTLADGAQTTLSKLKVGSGSAEVGLTYVGSKSATKSETEITYSTEGIATATYDPSTGKLKVTPVAAGETTVHINVIGGITYQGVSIDIPVKVAAADDPLNVNASYTLTVGGASQTISYTGELDYTVNKDGIVSVTKSADGKTLTVAPVAAGTAMVTITAVGTDLTPAKVAFTVNPAASTAKPVVVLDPITLMAGTKVSGAVTMKDASGNVVSDAITVKSSDESIAKASYADGKLTVQGIAEGTSTVTLSSDSLDSDYTVKVTVTKAPTITFTDESGKGVTADTSAISISSAKSDSVIKLTVSLLQSGTDYDALKAKTIGTLLGVYEADLTLDGTAVHTGFGSVALSFPVDASYDGQTVTVWHKHQDGTITSETATVANGMATVTATDLSSFAVDGSSSTGTTSTGTSGTTGTTSGTGLSKTGDNAMAMVWGAGAVVVAAAAGAVAYGRRRRRMAGTPDDGEPLDKAC